MTTHQIQLVQGSWEQVKPIAQTAGMLFYNKLFEAAPHARSMFGENINEQAAKLTAMLGYIVAKLNRLEDLLDEVEKLAIRHNKYGAQPEHYAVVGQCLIATLSEGLGAAWNNELQDAWIAAYTILSNAMITAQQQATGIAA